MKNKYLISIVIILVFIIGGSAGVLAAANSVKISALIEKGMKVSLKDKSWTPKKLDGTAIYPITYNGTVYMPVKELGDALGVKVVIDNKNGTLNIASSAKISTDKTNTTKITSAKELESYLKSNYGKSSPLKTSVGNIPFTISVTENKSKFVPYDFLISFNYDIKAIDQKVFDLENSIDSNDKNKALNTNNTIKNFIENIARDVVAKFPKKKIRGETDGSYYKYPNIKVDYISYIDNVWVNYDFVDPESIFADHYNPLTEYGDTSVSTFHWAPKQY
jgi:hypothetical protein